VLSYNIKDIGPVHAGSLADDEDNKAGILTHIASQSLESLKSIA
jgi:hypothetical protein